MLWASSSGVRQCRTNFPCSFALNSTKYLRNNSKDNYKRTLKSKRMKVDWRGCTRLKQRQLFHFHMGFVFMSHMYLIECQEPSNLSHFLDGKTNEKTKKMNIKDNNNSKKEKTKENKKSLISLTKGSGKGLSSRHLALRSSSNSSWGPFFCGSIASKALKADPSSPLYLPTAAPYLPTARHFIQLLKASRSYRLYLNRTPAYQNKI